MLANFGAMAIEEKAKVVVDAMTDKEVLDIFALFGFEPESTDRVYGGYASSNFKVVGRKTGETTSTTFLLKINHYGLTVEDADHQLFIMNHLRQSSFPTNYPNAAPSGSLLVEHGGRKAMLLDFVHAVAGDKVLAADEKRASSVLTELGATLARLHQVKWPEEQSPGKKVRDITSGYPVCNTGDLLKGDELAKLEADERFSTHALVKDLRKNTPFFNELYKREVPWGIIHGDAFLDNTLFDEEKCKLMALVDWEDSCLGPYVMDLAVCASAVCFTAANELIEDRFRVLVKAYTAQRSLSALEKASFIDFMMAAAISCAFYRFCEFNVRQPDSDAVAKDSYKIMFERAQKFQREHPADPESKRARVDGVQAVIAKVLDEL